MEALAVEAEGLLKQDLVFHCPVVREGGEVGQVRQRLLHVVLVPEQHAKGLRNIGEEYDIYLSINIIFLNTMWLNKIQLNMFVYS